MEGTCALYYCWDKVYRRSFLIQNELFFPEGIRKSEDRCFILSCFEKLDTLVYVQDLLYHYRMLNSSVCHKYSSTIDNDRRILASHLQIIADRMDKALGQMYNDPNYNQIDKELRKFIYYAITDVLFLKFYHPDNPDKKTRRKDAIRFIRSEPFSSAIRKMRYRDLGMKSKLKKLLLTMGFVDTFCKINHHILSRDSGVLFKAE